MQIKNTYSNPYFTMLQDRPTSSQLQISNMQKETTSNPTEDSTPNQEDPKTINEEDLEQSQIQQIRELEQIDRNVRTHESAHIAAGAGVVTGGASFSYTRGPDGKMYAIAGEVPISMDKGDTPEETIANARKIIAAAMAPSDPSPQDYKVAASAAQMEIEARMELARERIQEGVLNNNPNTSSNPNQDSIDTHRNAAMARYKQNLNY